MIYTLVVFATLSTGETTSLAFGPYHHRECLAEQTSVNIQLAHRDVRSLCVETRPNPAFDMGGF